jgi:Zn-dependent protease/CBS domain-containing protein
MRKGLQIGRFFGINVRVDWSWLLILFLVTWNLSTVFGQLHADWGTGLRWGTALIAALLFFASVLAHELAHSLVAERRGMSVRNITLFMFGGVSNIQREPESPQAEFWMAIVGPISSLVIGAMLVALVHIGLGPLAGTLANPAQVMAQLSAVSTLLLWLGFTNITLGFFNLIPGFPLDGGRILRSILWAATDNLRRATRWAAGVGQAIAWLMIAGGVAMIFGARIPFFGTGFGNGMWLVFIGWFLHGASTQSYQRVVIQDILEGVPVRRMMRPEPPTVSPQVSIGELVHEYMMGSDSRNFAVLDNGNLVGMVTLQDVRSVPRESWDVRTVSEIMTSAGELASVSPDEDASHALMVLARRDVRQLPVLRGGDLIGVLRRRDIIRWLQLESEFGS